MRRVATCYAKTCDQSDPVRGEAKMHYRVPIGDPTFHSFDSATFFCTELPYGAGFTFCGSILLSHIFFLLM